MVAMVLSKAQCHLCSEPIFSVGFNQIIVPVHIGNVCAVGVKTKPLCKSCLKVIKKLFL